MIIGTFRNDLVIGEKRIAHKLSDPQGKLHNNVPFVVLEEVTADDYEAWTKEVGGIEPPSRELRHGARYYRISMD